MSPKQSSFNKFDSSLVKGFKDKYSQGFLFGILNPLYLRFGFLYITPGSGTKKQIYTILNSYEYNNCDVIMGDLNLNPKYESDQERINQLCNDNLEMALKEETTTDSKNQIDHILTDKTLRGRIFVTSYFNFSSNHKLIVARIGTNGNSLTKEAEKNIRNTNKIFGKKNIANHEKTEQKQKEEKNENLDMSLSDDDNESLPTQEQYINLSSLDGVNWLTDVVINEYGRLLNEQVEEIFVFSTHFLK